MSEDIFPKKDREHLDTSMSKAMLKLSAQMAKQIQANPQAAASLSKSQKKMMAQMKNMDTKDMPDTNHQSGSDFFCDFRIQSDRT
mgnify:CR=1 FL=1